MITAIPEHEIEQLVCHQLSSMWQITDRECELINIKYSEVKVKLEQCFAPNPNKYYHRNGETYFNPFHSGQYCIFLYLLAREIFQAGDPLLADKIYYLNISLDHPVGSVMGRAKYENGFSFSQCCTVGNNRGIYPILGKNVRMCAFSSIIGNCKVGDNVIIGSNSGIKDIDVPANTMVFGHTPNNIFKPIK